MARVAGVDLPKNKRIEIALRYLNGVGPTTSREILGKLNGAISPDVRVKDLSESQVGLLNSLLAKEYKVEGDLRRAFQADIQRLYDINCFRGFRHRRNLPVRGQRTRTNARTRRGRRKTIGSGARPVAQAKPAPKPQGGA